ncbi:MAG: class I SAM-dependent DNA methyltransferase [Proteobacteria bacterium]|nr:class I SAM-dependent DNA methyltransferase [Pseudomonadota bacterium]
MANLLPTAYCLLPFMVSQDINVFHKAIDVLLATFDWSKISPAIFGSMFQGIMDPEERREIGAHYTSEENILKVINPLFMDDLWAEFERVKATPKKLEAFHEKIANLRILDPACGCGNFLITTYKALRRLELEIIKMKYPSRQRLLDVSPLIKVSIDQFYGIEILDFPCEVARTGMWLIEHLMNREVGEWFGMAYADLPLKRSAHIYHTNALRVDWQELLRDDDKYTADLRFDYIVGNPPYVGKKEQKTHQKDDIRYVLGQSWKNAGNLDYVTAWYKKAFDMMEFAPRLRAGFVSTNSITQGEQVPDTWMPLFSKGMQFDFAYRTFKWTNEGRGKAAVHCVIIGFSKRGNDLVKEKVIYNSDGKRMVVNRINPYLVDADTIFISTRKKVLNNAPVMKYGSMPIDNGNLIIETIDDYNEIINEDSENAQMMRKYIGGDELLNNYHRWCLWLVFHQL